MNDASDLGAKLKGYGFDVTVALDCSHKQMDQRLKEFRALLKTHEVALFFFAGHGMQIDGTNYLLATDTDMDTESDAKFSSLSLDKVVDAMAKSTASTRSLFWMPAAATRGSANGTVRQAREVSHRSTPLKARSLASQRHPARLHLMA